MPKIVVTALFLLIFNSSASANLINGSFTDFSGWEGIIYDGNDTVVGDLDADSHFNLVTDGLEISNDVSFWEIVLFQTFIVPNNATFLSFDFSWSLTAPFIAGSGLDSDFVQAALIDNGNGINDMFPGATDFSLAQNSGSISFDMSGFAGTEVTIEFIVQDGDFDERDSFTIGSMVLETDSSGGGNGGNPIPSPSSLILLLGALALLVRSSKTH